MRLSDLCLTATTKDQLAQHQDKPWFERLCNLFALHPDRLSRATESHLFEECEEDNVVLNKCSQDLTRGYPLDLIENPVLHFCLPAGGKVHKYFLDTTSIFESNYPKALNLDTRKWSKVSSEMWSDLMFNGHTCNIYSRVISLPWHQVNRTVQAALQQGFVCKVEYVSPRRHGDTEGDTGGLLRQVMDTVQDIVKQEGEDEEFQENGVYALAERRLRAGCYQFVRGYLYTKKGSRAGQKPGCKSFVDADQWAEAKGGLKAREGCVVHIPTHRIRAITVRNLKYIVSDFELA